MAKRNITLVQLNNPRDIAKKGLRAGNNIWDALGMQRIGAVLKENNYNVNIIQQYREPEEKIFERLVETNPDVVGLSTWTCTWPLNLELVKKIKDYNQKVLIVSGGYHTSSNPSSILEGDIDYGIKGEGELSFLRLLDNLNKNKDVSSLDNLILREGKSARVNLGKRLENLDELPDPLRNSEMLGITKVKVLMDPPISKQRGVVMIDYSRGCVFACKYCDSNLVWGKNVTYRSPERVVNELKRLKTEFGTNTAYFSDLTFNLDRGKTLELCDLLSEADLGIKFYVTSRLAAPNGKPLVDQELLSRMKLAGIQKLGWGIESFSEGTKKDFRKDISLEYIKEVFDMAHSLGLSNRCFLMLGHRDESKETINQTIEKLKYLRPDELRLSFLTPFPGTPLWEETEKSNLLTKNLRRFTTNEPVIKSGLTSEELIKAREKINIEYYNSQEYLGMVQEKLKLHSELKPAYDEFLSFLKEYEVLK